MIQFHQNWWWVTQNITCFLWLIIHEVTLCKNNGGKDTQCCFKRLTQAHCIRDLAWRHSRCRSYGKNSSTTNDGSPFCSWQLLGKVAWIIHIVEDVGQTYRCKVTTLEDVLPLLLALFGRAWQHASPTFLPIIVLDLGTVQRVSDSILMSLFPHGPDWARTNT